MKNLKIIALVIGAHVAALAVMLSSQGCRSTTAPADKVAATTGEADAPVAPVAPVRTNTTVFQPIAVNVPGAVAPTPATPPPDRFAPTRPGTAAAAETLPAQSYVVKKNDNLGAIARRHGITKEELTRANNLSSSTILKIGQKLVIPTPKSAGSTGAAAVTDGGPTYKVRSGDTLGAIARRHGVSVAALRAANGMSSDAIGVGQELRIPVVVSNSTMANSNVPTAPGATTPATTGASVDSGLVMKSKTSLGNGGRGAGRHTVALGETIGVIARRYKVSEVAIMTANNITNAKSIRPGQELIIPGAAGTAAPPQPAIEADPIPAQPSLEPLPVQPAGGGDAPVQPVEEAPPVVPVS